MALQRRMIYAQLTENKDFATMTDKAQKTYIFLIVLADDDGRLKGDTEWLRIKIFPYDLKVTTTMVKGFVREIDKAKLITWYKSDDDGNYYIQHPNWDRFQILRPDRRKMSDIPPPDDGHLSDGGERKLIKRSKEEKQYASLEYLKKIPEADLEEMYQKFDASKLGIQRKGEDFFYYCQAHGKKYKNYKAALLNCLRRDIPIRKEPPRVAVIAPVEAYTAHGEELEPRSDNRIPKHIKDDMHDLINNIKKMP